MNQPIVVPSGVPRPERIVYPESPRLRRIRSLSALMDQSIVLPNGFRIGLDALVGIIPGVGDVVSGVISCYLVYESARLGMQKRILLKMLGNIALDSAVGAIPILGDLFDLAWKSNMRNVRLLEKHYRPTQRERTAGDIALWMGIMVALLSIVVGLAFYLVAKVIVALFGGLFPG